MKNKLVLTGTLALFLMAGQAFAQSINGTAGVNTNLGINSGMGSTSTTTGTTLNTDINNGLRTDSTTNFSTNTTSSAVIPPNMNSDQFDSFVSSHWDANADGIIDRSEWTSSSRAWFGPRTRNVGSFSVWDTNRNGRLDATELNTGLSKSRLYQQYDINGDGMLDISESDRIPVR